MNRIIDLMQNTEGIWEMQKHNPVTFIHGDNMAFLRKCKDEMLKGYFHIGIVDPPYGVDIGKQRLGAAKGQERAYEKGDWDGEVPTQEYWELLSYCCRNLIVWGGNYFTKEIGWSGRCWGEWDKGNDKLDFAFGELCLTTFDRNPFRIPKSRNLQEQDGDKRHHTQKPVYLYDYLHLNFVEKGDRVLDTHGGSFSHAVAAWKNKHELVIMDKQRSYFDRGIAHYKKESSRLPEMLF